MAADFAIRMCWATYGSPWFAHYYIDLVASTARWNPRGRFRVRVSVKDLARLPVSIGPEFHRVNKRRRQFRLPSLCVFLKVVTRESRYCITPYYTDTQYFCIGRMSIRVRARPPWAGSWRVNPAPRRRMRRKPVVYFLYRLIGCGVYVFFFVWKGPIG